MRRTVEQMVQDPLAEEILRGHIRPGELVKVGVDKESLVFYQGSAEKLLKNHQSNMENSSSGGEKKDSPDSDKPIKTNRKSGSAE